MTTSSWIVLWTDQWRCDSFRSPAAQTEFSTAELLERYRAAVALDRHHPVLLIGVFILDLLTIHPFADGNGRVARVLTNALLDDAGYQVGRFVSLEHLIAESR